MQPTTARLDRPLSARLAPLHRLHAIAAALLLALCAAPKAEAQSRQTPSPVSAEQLSNAMRDAGLGSAARERGLELHEEYFVRFRDFEAREVDPALGSGARDFGIARTAAEARAVADTRRRLLQRAAQIDGQLVDELASTLGAEEALRAERVRTALTRRRAAAILPPFGRSADALSFDLRGVPALATLEPDARTAIAPTLDAYDADFTRLSERLAAAIIARPVRAAELREELGVASTPAVDGVADEENGRKWFEAMQDVQRRSGVEMEAEIARIRRLHRDTVEQLAPLVPTIVAHRLRTEMIRKGLGLALEKSEFDTVFAQIESMRAAGKLDDDRFSAANAVLEGHAPAARAAFEELANEQERARAAEGDDGMVAIRIGGDDGANPAGDDLARAKERFRELDLRGAEALRLAAGLDAADAGRPGREIAMPADAIGGQAGLQVGGIAIMVGGDGEQVVLSGEDLGDAGFVFGGFGGAPRVVAPMKGAELDALAGKLGFDESTRPVFDEIVARAAEARAEAERANPGPRQVNLEGGEGGLTLSLSIGEDGAVDLGGGGDAKALAEAVDALEERMFDELKAAAAAERAAAAEAARRARARVRLASGESAGVSADLVAIADSASLDAAARAMVEPTVARWDEGSVDALRSYRGEMARLRAERDELQKSAMTEQVVEGEDGDTKVGRTFAVDAELAERMQSLERKIQGAQKRFIEAKRGTLDEMAGLLDASSAQSLRRAYLRATEPALYRTARDLEPFFSRALRAVGDDAAAQEAIGVFRAEWIEAREARLETFITERDAALAKAADDMGARMASMQDSMRERRRLRGDLEQIEATSHRKLVEFVASAVGEERAKEIGELPKRERPAMQMQFGP